MPCHSMLLCPPTPTLSISLAAFLLNHRCGNFHHCMGGFDTCDVCAIARRKFIPIGRLCTGLVAWSFISFMCTHHNALGRFAFRAKRERPAHVHRTHSHLIIVIEFCSMKKAELKMKFRKKKTESHRGMVWMQCACARFILQPRHVAGQSMVLPNEQTPQFGS